MKDEKAYIEAATGLAAAALGMLKAERDGNVMMYEINRDILKKEVNEYYNGVGAGSVFAEVI